jgi:diguanylate cyclase (GGDEF)-like protein
MEQILPDNWAIMHLGLIFCITCAQMLIVYVLSDSSNPPAGLGLFTVYFMAALLGWIAFTLQQGNNPPMTVDVPSVAAILNSYILFLAAGQRAGLTWGRRPLGLICLLACLSVFFLDPQRMFAVQAGTAAFFFAGTGILCGLRGWRQANVGDAIIAFAAILMVGGIPLALFQQFVNQDLAGAQSIAFGTHSTAYVLVAVGFLASVLIEYQQYLSHLATEDPLTRLFNRRGMEDALQVTLAQAARKQTPTSALMVDIDHFKQVNDSFGHDVGDQVIRQVADLLERLSRSSDVVARTGGEEYLLILPDTGLGAARVLGERIRSAIGDHALLIENQRIKVTVSVGVACLEGESNLDDLAQEADRALYLAKRGGRNRVSSVENTSLRLRTAAGNP